MVLEQDSYYVLRNSVLDAVLTLSLICSVNTSETPVTAHLYQVKKGDRDVHKKKLSWLLRDLRCVDGKSAEKANIL